MKTTPNLHPARLPGLNLTTTTITSWRPRRFRPTIMACLGFLLTVAIVRADSPPQILKTSLSGTTLTILGQNLPTGPLGDGLAAAPDGKRIAFGFPLKSRSPWEYSTT